MRSSAGGDDAKIPGLSDRHRGARTEKVFRQLLHSRTESSLQIRLSPLIAEKSASRRGRNCIPVLGNVIAAAPNRASRRGLQFAAR